jgi:hypothetical protein
MRNGSRTPSNAECTMLSAQFGMHDEECTGQRLQTQVRDAGRCAMPVNAKC